MELTEPYTWLNDLKRTELKEPKQVENRRTVNRGKELKGVKWSKEV